MPELPEVETIRRDLEKKILKKKITRVEILKKKIVRSNADKFVMSLAGGSFSAVGRIGKLMYFTISGKGESLLVHLGMTGQLVYKSDHKLLAGGHFTPDFLVLPNKHTRAIFYFNDKSALYFNDMRMFGYLELADGEKLKNIKSHYGIEPLQINFTFPAFREIFKDRKIAVKAALLNQNLISGIGNIYADEILFKAGVRPDRPSNTLKERELKAIFDAAKTIIKKAIEHRGTTFSDYVDSGGKKGNYSRFLRVYGRYGEKCYKCSGVVKRMKLAGRGTSFCPRCQK